MSWPTQQRHFLMSVLILTHKQKLTPNNIGENNISEVIYWGTDLLLICYHQNHPDVFRSIVSKKYRNFRIKKNRKRKQIYARKWYYCEKSKRIQLNFFVSEFFLTSG